MARTVLRLRHKTSAWASWLNTAMAHLHVRNIAHRFDLVRFVANDISPPVGVPD
jgi:hypothetical protein